MKPKILSTKNYELRPYSKQDEDRFVEMGMDAEVVKFMYGASGVEQEERTLFRNILEIYDDTISERIFNIWGIYENDKLCGHLELKETEHTSDEELEIVYMLHPAERGKGIMREVLNFIKDNQFFLQKKIIATVQADNQKSLQLLTRWGIDRQKTYEEERQKYFKIWLKQADNSMLFWGF